MAEGRAHLGMALTLWSEPERSWTRLYSILEEVEMDLGMEVDKAGLCETSERRIFRRSANSAEVAGLDARHATGKFEAPHNPMSISDGTEFIRTILLRRLKKHP